MSLARVSDVENKEPRFGLGVFRNALVAALILWLPFAIRYSLSVEVHSPHLQRYLLKATTLGPLDVLLVVAALSALPLLLRRATYRNWPIALIGTIMLAVATAILVLVEPTAEGFARVARFAGLVGVVAIVRWMPTSTYRSLVIWPLTISVLVQAPWALAHTFLWHSGHQTGITNRFDHAWTQGYGTMDGAYALAAFMVLAIAIILASGAFARLHPIMWVSVVLASASISATFGRQGVLAAVAIAGLYAIAWIAKRNKEYFRAAVATLVPMSIGIAVAWQGWSVRASETAAGYQSGREGLLNRAFTVIEANPLFGVGPGRIGPALQEIGLTEADWTYVHNIPVLVAAEYGIPIGILFTVWLGLLGITALFTSVRATAVFVAVLPYLLFDHPHLVYVYGTVELGLWLAVLDYHRLHKNGSSAPIEESAGITAPSIVQRSGSQIDAGSRAVGDYETSGLFRYPGLGSSKR